MFRLIHTNMENFEIREIKRMRSQCLILVKYFDRLAVILERRVKGEHGVNDFVDAKRVAGIILSSIALMDRESKQILKEGIARQA